MPIIIILCLVQVHILGIKISLYYEPLFVMIIVRLTDCVFPGLTFHHGNRGLHQHQTGARPADGGGRPPIHYYVIHPNDGDDQHNKGNAKLMFGSNYIAWRHYLPLLQFMPVSVPNPPISSLFSVFIGLMFAHPFNQLDSVLARLMLAICVSLPSSRVLH